MPKSKAQKSSDLEEIKRKIGDAKSIVFADYKGVKVKDFQELRKSLKKGKGSIEVTKINLARIAFEKNKSLDEIVGKASLAIGYSFDDEVSAPKIIKKFGKTNENVKLLGGFCDGKFMTKEEIERLADIPSKEELLVKLLFTIKSPIYKLVGNLGGQTPKLVRVLKAISEKG